MLISPQVRSRVSKSYTRVPLFVREDEKEVTSHQYLLSDSDADEDESDRAIHRV